MPASFRNSRKARLHSCEIQLSYGKKITVTKNSIKSLQMLKALANGFNICFNIHSILLNAVGRLLNDVERWDEQTVSTFDSTKLREWAGN